MQRMQRIKRSLRASPRGFTVVELAVVIVILGAIFPLLIALLLNAYSDSFNADDKMKMNAQATQAIWYMEDTIRTANGYMATVLVSLPTPMVPIIMGRPGQRPGVIKAMVQIVGC